MTGTEQLYPQSIYGLDMYDYQYEVHQVFPNDKGKLKQGHVAGRHFFSLQTCFLAIKSHETWKLASEIRVKFTNWNPKFSRNRVYRHHGSWSYRKYSRNIFCGCFLCTHSMEPRNYWKSDDKLFLENIFKKMGSTEIVMSTIRLSVRPSVCDLFLGRYST
jgi:hypothetical protein